MFRLRAHLDREDRFFLCEGYEFDQQQMCNDLQRQWDNLEKLRLEEERERQMFIERKKLEQHLYDNTLIWFSFTHDCI